MRAHQLIAARPIDVSLHTGAHVGQRQIQPYAEVHGIDQRQPEQQRDQRCHEEPADGLDAHAADGAGVPHLGDADRQRGEHERRDDHLNHPQENVRKQRNVACDGLRRLRCGK